VDSDNVAKICEALEGEDYSLFVSKAHFDTLGSGSAIIGREDKAKELIRLILAYRKGHVVPLISVYGKSGSGKSAVVKFVCENLNDYISYVFVNLRKAKTVFGCANVILGELGESTVHSAQGTTNAVEKITKAIEERLAEKNQNGKKLFVMVLDEFDILFQDRRGKPSDFIYDLLLVQEKLREKGELMCIVAISNNVLAEYELDDKIRSRIGNSEIFFPPYGEKEIEEILRDRAEKAFQEKIDDEVIKQCAQESSDEHGDARRAIDFLRIAAEIAESKKERLAKSHVIEAREKLESERVHTVLTASAKHVQLACASLARIEYLTGQGWHSTSTLYNQYMLLARAVRHVTYRRFSQLLREVVNMGLAVSRTGSKGRYGYGTEYKLTVPPHMVGYRFDREWWLGLQKEKQKHELYSRNNKYDKLRDRYRKHAFDIEQAWNIEGAKEVWDNFVGLKE
jgi:archaeal cell division control protein 6